MSRRWSTWIWGLAVLAVVVGGASRLRFDADVLGLLPADLPVVQGLRLHQAHFGGAHQLIVTVSSDEPDASAAAAKAIAAGLGSDSMLVRRALWQAPWLQDPLSSSEFLAWSWFQQPEAEVQRLVARLQPGTLPQILAEARDQLAVSVSPAELAKLSYDPLGLTGLPGAGLADFDRTQRLFGSEDGRFRIVFVEPASGATGFKEEIAWLATIQRKIAQIRETPAFPQGVRIGFTGGPVFAAEAATGMERDMTQSAIGTLAIIALLFWIAHRRWRPLLVLVAALGASVLITFAVGALLIGRLNIISIGFAAILLGLVVDYGLVAYQERCEEPAEDVPALRRRIGPGIFWSALTTAGAFLLLNLGGLPGLAQLGTLVGIGIMVGLGVMLFGFLPFAGTPTRPAVPSGGAGQPKAGPFWSARLLGAVLLAALVLLGVRGLPSVDHSQNSLRPRGSAAYAEMERVQARLEQPEAPLFLLTRGASEQDVAARLGEARRALTAGASLGLVSSFVLAESWWPNPAMQATNASSLRGLVAAWPRIRSSATGAGFSGDSLALADGIVRNWSNGLAQTRMSWPTGAVADWVFRQAAAKDADGWFALGLVRLGNGGTNAPSVLQMPVGDGSVLTGWPLLGEAILLEVTGRLGWMVGGILVFLLLCLWGAFRDWREVALGVLALAAGFVALLAIMRVCGWSWNLLNLMALPLLLGTGVDYTIHVQLAMRRHLGDRRAVWRNTGKALLLCGGTTIAGFGSLAWAGNMGLASLGQVCATGVLCVLATSLVALPGWWNWAVGRRGLPGGRDGRPAGSKPSAIYHIRAWRLALGVARLVPLSCFQFICVAGARVYRVLNPARFSVVSDNLRAVVGDARANEEAARLFGRFGIKLCDLWRYEAGLPVQDQFRELTGWENLRSAVETGRGVLLITIHLGNWEFGAPLLAARGIRLLVLTQPEPGDGFTEMRRSARERWGIETFVVGEDPFAFVEIIKRLQAGRAVALLMDRPPPGSGVEVELFGQPFMASIAAAELARASGCMLVPAFIPKTGTGYAAHILQPVAYDRATLNSRASRTALTAEILRVFEPAIRKHPDQWFHFVPLWPKRAASKER